MSTGTPAVTVQCMSFREYFSAANFKSMIRGFVYEYETPKIVTIHSVSIALTCRFIQLLIFIYGIGYLMIHKKGYQEMDTSIISSITLKVKGIGYNQTAPNKTLVIDGADYIVPPQENNALFLMTNFIRTDQEHKRCPESTDEKESSCTSDKTCESNKNFPKANGRWTGRCHFEKNNTSSMNTSQINPSGTCELEGWCPVENDHTKPKPISDVLNFTIFVKNFIEFPRFKVIRKNIEQHASYLRKCQYDQYANKACPIFRVGKILELVEADPEERMEMLRIGGVIRVKIDWKCDLDKVIEKCAPAYSFGRLDARFSEESFSPGFNFRFASHWKHENRSFRTLTKAFGLRFIISVSGQAGRFDVITLSLNIGSLIGILGLATFICDIVALYVHRSSDVYRQQKFQDVDLNLLRLETLNSLAEGMMSETMKRKHQAQLEDAHLTSHVIGNNDAISLNHSPYKENFRRNKENHHNQLYDNVTSTPILPLDNYHQKSANYDNPTAQSPIPSLSSTSIKQRHAMPNRSTQSSHDANDRSNIPFADDLTPEIYENSKTKSPTLNRHDHANRPSPKIETFL